MKVDILTFNEWLENSVYVVKSNGIASICSRQNKKEFRSEQVRHYELIEEGTPEDRNFYWMKIYSENYDWIQEQHQIWLKENSLDNVETN